MKISKIGNKLMVLQKVQGDPNNQKANNDDKRRKMIGGMVCLLIIIVIIGFILLALYATKVWIVQPAEITDPTEYPSTKSPTSKPTFTSTTLKPTFTPTTINPIPIPVVRYGCADGTREAFQDVVKFPNIAGCAATWDGNFDMSSTKIEYPCGNNLAKCRNPKDACDIGWHICGRSGLRDLYQITANECASAGVGNFASGISHVTQLDQCSVDWSSSRVYPCFTNGWGSESVCCGTNCAYGTCQNGVWSNSGTHIIVSNTGIGCGATPSSATTGILCCRD